MTSGANLRSKGQMSRSLDNENIKIVFFAHVFVKSGSIYIKPRSTWSPAHSTHIIEYISPAKMLRFVIICNYPGGPDRTSQRSPGRLPTCFNSERRGASQRGAQQADVSDQHVDGRSRTAPVESGERRQSTDRLHRQNTRLRRVQPSNQPVVGCRPSRPDASCPGQPHQQGRCSW